MTTQVEVSMQPATAAPEPAAPLLSVSDLKVSMRLGKNRYAPVVRGVSFEVAPSETLILLGESGSGKSVTARSILRLHGSAARVSGTVALDGKQLLTTDEKDMQRIRGSVIGFVPQDPNAALDPLRRVGAQIVEVLKRHKIVTGRKEGATRAEELLAQVGIPDPKRVSKALPHELSGGMRQRAVIAMGIACEPRLLIADEPTTALDVTVQAQALELFGELQQQLGMGLLMVTHDVGVAREIGDRIAVMYAGMLVESGPAQDLVDSPRHPYTAGLLGALPRPGVERGRLLAIPGMPPAAGAIPEVGCAFAPRCPLARQSCIDDTPLLVSDGARAKACPVVDGTDHAPLDLTNVEA